MEALTKENKLMILTLFPLMIGKNILRIYLDQIIENNQQHLNQEKYIQENITQNNLIFEQPLKKSEILYAVKNLKKNKSTSFD